MKMQQQPVGVFDSGVGGLSVWKELIRKLPQEQFIYFADSANAPYGSKPESEIIERCVYMTEFLLQQDCKLIVVACNTATAAAIDILRAQYNIPFVGMEPALKPAAEKTTSGVIGILGTEGTLNGRLFKETKERFGKGVQIDLQIGGGLVSLVEEGKENSDQAKELLQRYLQPMLNRGADHVVLGCTHYPFLLESIREIVGNNVEIIDPAPAVAARTKAVLAEAEISCYSQAHQIPYLFYATGNLDRLQAMALSLSGEQKEKFSFQLV